MERTHPYYDPAENVIFSDLSRITLTLELVHKFQADVIALAQTLPQKVFVLVCWQDTKLTPEAAEELGSGLTKVLQYVRGVVRYGVNSGYSSIAIRTQTVRHHLQRTQSHIYATREEALAAVRLLEQADQDKEEKK